MKRSTGVTVIAVFLIVGATVLPAFVVLFPLKNANTFSKSLLMLMSFNSSQEYVFCYKPWNETKPVGTT